MFVIAIGPKKDSGRERGGGDDFDAGIDTGVDSAGDDIGAESVKSSALSGKLCAVNSLFDFHLKKKNIFFHSTCSQR